MCVSATSRKLPTAVHPCYHLSAPVSRPPACRPGSAVPRFAIIVPAYNASETIRETLNAVSAQHYADWECVVVNDGSTDQTPDIVREYCRADERFRLVEQVNQGAPAAHNAGVRASTADFLVLCAADDYLFPNHLSAMAELAASRAECSIFSSNGEYLYPDGSRRTVYPEEVWRHERFLTFEQVLSVCFFSVGAVYRRSIFDEVGGFRVGVYVDDYDFWLRTMLRGAKHVYTPEVLATHRISATQQSADVLRVFDSNVEVFMNLKDEDGVTPEQVQLIDAAIATREKWIRDTRWRQSAERQADRIRPALQKLVGEQLSTRMLDLLLSARGWLRLRRIGA